MGARSGLFWTVIEGAFSEQDFQRYLSCMSETVPDFSPGEGAMLTLARRPRMLNSTERRALAALVDEGVGQGLRAHAIVSRSSVTRRVLTAMNWLSSKPFVEKVFEETDPAVAWLREQCPSVPDDAFATVPAFVKHR